MQRICGSAGRLRRGGVLPERRLDGIPAILVRPERIFQDEGVEQGGTPGQSIQAECRPCLGNYLKIALRKFRRQRVAKKYFGNEDATPEGELI